MRAFSAVVVAFLVLGLAIDAPAGDNEDLIKEVTAIGDAFSKAIVEDDTDFMFSQYVEDAISLPNFGPRMDGIEAFKKHHAEMAAAGMKITSFESEPTNAWEAGDNVIEIGNYTISLEMPGMGQVDDAGKYMTVYLRQKDGSLKVKAETWNTDMNPMAMMGGGEGGHEHGHGHGHEHGHGHGHGHEHGHGGAR